MDIDKLVTMANQIGTFFASYPDGEEARTEIALHLQRFWAPRMRTQLYSHIDAHAGMQSGLAPLVLSAIAAHRGEPTPPPPPGGDAG